MSTWDDGKYLIFASPGVSGRVRGVLRVVAMAVIIFGLMGPMLLLRLAGFFCASQWIVGQACRAVLWVIGIPIVCTGHPMSQPGAVVANHVSWLDIFSLNAVQKVLFVAKAEVRGWPLLGLIASSVGTVFIERRQRDAVKHRKIIQECIIQQKRLLFFPEGTSTDGRCVLRFRSSLFAAFFEDGLRESVWIQPATLVYVAPKGWDARIYAWWGSADFPPHLFAILAMKYQGRIELTFHEPIRVRDVADRKDMALRCEMAVRTTLTDAIKVG